VRGELSLVLGKTIHWDVNAIDCIGYSKHSGWRLRGSRNKCRWVGYIEWRMKITDAI
jgi:hypothetical protein